jgi:hypothetical protein
LPDDSPALEAPVPVDPDIIDSFNVGKSASNHNVHNISHLKCFTDNCDSFDYVSQLHDFIDGCNNFENFGIVTSKENDFYCNNVCLDSDFVQFSLKFVGNGIDLDDSLARERLSCKFVHIFNINHSKNNFASGLEFYFNKYWGNNYHVKFSGNLSVYTSFYQALYQFYLSDNCGNIVSILARNVSFLSFDLDLHHCCLAGRYSSVFSRHVYIDYVKFDLDFIVSRLFAYFKKHLIAVILYIYKFFHRFIELYFCENGNFISPVNVCNCDLITQYIADYYPHHIYLPTCIPLFNNSNVTLYEAREFIEAEFIDFIATPLVACVQYFSVNEPIRVRRSNVNHLLAISLDFDWSADLEICCDCTETKFNCEFSF